MSEKVEKEVELITDPIELSQVNVVKINPIQIIPPTPQKGVNFVFPSSQVKENQSSKSTPQTPSPITPREDTIKTVIIRDPISLDYHTSLQLFRHGDLSTALKTIKKHDYELTHPLGSEIFNLIFDIYIIQGRYRRAKKMIMKKYIDLSNKIFLRDFNYYMSVVSFYEKKYNVGVEFLKKNISNDRFCSFEYYCLAKFYEKMGDYSNSLTQYKWAANLDDKCRFPRYTSSVLKILLKMKKYNVAKQECLKAIKKFKDTFEFKVLLVKILKLVGENERAKNLLKRFLKQNNEKKANDYFKPNDSFRDVKALKIPNLEN